MEYAWISDVLVAALLATTLAFVARLHRRLESLRAGRREFEGLIERFTRSVDQAEQKMAGIKVTAAEAGTALQERIDRAERLKDDLAFLADKAGRLADQLEASIARRRPTAPHVVPASAPAGSTPARIDRPQRPVEAKPGNSLPDGPGRELLQALASVR